MEAWPLVSTHARVSEPHTPDPRVGDRRARRPPQRPSQRSGRRLREQRPHHHRRQRRRPPTAPRRRLVQRAGTDKVMIATRPGRCRRPQRPRTSAARRGRPVREPRAAPRQAHPGRRPRIRRRRPGPRRRPQPVGNLDNLNGDVGTVTRINDDPQDRDLHVRACERGADHAHRSSRGRVPRPRLRPHELQDAGRHRRSHLHARG